MTNYILQISSNSYSINASSGSYTYSGNDAVWLYRNGVAKPVIDSITPGDGLLLINYSHPGSFEWAEFFVDGVGGSNYDNDANRSKTILGLTNGIEYDIQMEVNIEPHISPRSDIVSATPMVVGAETLPADSGSYTYTGTDSILDLNSGINQITAASGNYSYTGTTATLTSSLSGALFYDDFESGDFNHTENGVSWNDVQGHPGEVPVISDDIAHAGTYAIRYKYIGAATGDDAWSETRMAFGQELTEFYMRYYIYFPDGTEGLGAKYQIRNEPFGGNNNKFLRVWANNYSPYTVKVGFSVWQLDTDESDASMVSEAGHNTGGMNYQAINDNIIDDSKLGKWIKVDIHIKTDSGSADGILHMQMDDVDIINHQDLDNYPTGGTGNYFKNMYLMGWSSSGFDNTTYVYIDDFTLSASPIS